MRYLHPSYIPAAALVGMLAIAGCQMGSHPDDQAAVYQNLDKNEMRSVTVHQNRDSGVITLTGIVGSDQRKSQAEEIAKQAAPGYTINNKLEVQAAGLQSMVKQAVVKSKSDDEIEKHFKATIKKHKSLENIQYSAYIGTLYLKGAVKTEEQRREAEELAKKVPDVQHVVDDLHVAQEKRSSANS